MAYWNVTDIRHLDRPHEWATMFGRVAPLVVEIGFGRAGHLIHLGKTQPQHNIIGIETSRTSLKKASSKAKNNHTDNVRIIDGSGYALLWLHISEGSLTELHINFPDPWPKERSMHRQLLDDNFMRLAATRLMKGGRLFIATDHPAYQPIVTDCVTNTPHFISRLPDVYSTVDNDRFRTKYELKALAEGRVPFYYKYERNDTAVSDRFMLPAEFSMPHAIVQIPISIDDIATQFSPFSPDLHGNDALTDINVRYTALFRTLHEPSLLAETYINEQPQDQRIGIKISQQNEEETTYILQIHTIGFPRPTTGAHAAIGRLSHWLTTLHPDAKIIRHNLQNPHQSIGG